MVGRLVMRVLLVCGLSALVGWASAPVPAFAAGADRVGDVDLSNMDAAERALFHKVVAGELCPCKVALSLGKCLQREDVCAMAVRAARLVAQRVEQGLSYGEVVDAMIRFLERSAKPRSFDLKDRPFKGAKDARVVLVEFSDFECPHCEKARHMLSKLAAEFPRDVAVYFKHYPLPFHKAAANAAAATEVARSHGKFWQVHDACFDSQADLSEERLYDILRKAGVDPSKVTPAQWDVARQRVLADRDEGEAAGINGTPTVFLNGIEVPSEDLRPEALSARVREALE